VVPARRSTTLRDTRVRNLIDEKFHGRLFGRAGPIHWPPRSPDVNRIDFFLWGHLKESVYLVRPAVGEVDAGMVYVAERTSVHRSKTD
jgi:hypothetical protein